MKSNTKRVGNALDEHRYLAMMIETAGSLGFTVETRIHEAMRGAIQFRNGPVSLIAQGINCDYLVWHTYRGGVAQCQATVDGVQSLLLSALKNAALRGEIQLQAVSK